MPAPLLSQIAPADGTLDADLADVSAVATAAGGDAVDLAEFKVKRGAVEFQVHILPLGAGAFRFSANVGLFPDDEAVTITFISKSVSGATVTQAITISCRGALGSQAGALQLGYFEQIAAGLKASLSMQSVTAGLGIVSHHARSSLGGFTLADLTSYVFTGASDIAPLQVSPARQFRILGVRCAVDVGLQHVHASLQAADILGAQIKPAQLAAVEVDVSPVIAFTRAGLEIGTPGAWLVIAALAVGKQQRACLLEGVEIEGGDSLPAFVDLMSELLALLR